jgi:hypothetical protein
MPIGDPARRATFPKAPSHGPSTPSPRGRANRIPAPRGAAKRMGEATTRGWGVSDNCGHPAGCRAGRRVGFAIFLRNSHFYNDFTVLDASVDAFYCKSIGDALLDDLTGRTAPAPRARCPPRVARNNGRTPAWPREACGAAVALLEPRWIPGQVEIDEVRAVSLQVDTFAGGIGADQDAQRFLLRICIASTAASSLRRWAPDASTTPTSWLPRQLRPRLRSPPPPVRSRGRGHRSAPLC